MCHVNKFSYLVFFKVNKIVNQFFRILNYFLKVLNVLFIIKFLKVSKIVPFIFKTSSFKRNTQEQKIRKLVQTVFSLLLVQNRNFIVSWRKFV